MWVEIIAIESKRTQIHFLIDVLFAVASMNLTKGLFTWSGGPRSSGVGFFCFHALGDTKQKKLTPLGRGPPLHVNRVLKSLQQPRLMQINANRPRFIVHHKRKFVEITSLPVKVPRVTDINFLPTKSYII